VAGGSGGGVELAACDRFDPEAGSWHQAATLSIPREYHVLVSLADGRVLAAGGLSHAGTVMAEPRSSAEVYDLAADRWEPVASMSTPRSGAGAARLGDGRVLVAGGYGPASEALSSAEIFDPASGGWSPASAPLGPVSQLLALADGRALGIARGSPVQIYDPAADAWSSAGALPNPGVESLTLLEDGRVLAIGDDGSGGRAWLWSPASGFEPTSPLSVDRSEVRAVRLAEGSVLAVGGRSTASPSVLAAVERYHPSTGTWTSEAPLLEARTTPALLLLPGGDVLVVGGRSDAGGWHSLASAERITPACLPLSCASATAACGAVADGCGGTLDCGGCGPGQVCVANACVCSPATCATVGAACGTAPDGCGGTLECGGCPAGLSCSAGACVDVTAPQVAILSPPSHGVVGATVEVRVEASDAVGVTLVELYLGSTRLASGAGPGPHRFLWQAGQFPYGPWTLEARASDAAGNVARSAPVQVTVQNPYATYDSTLKVPRCPIGAECRSGSLLSGRGPLGPERNAPNTVYGQCADGTSGTYLSDESLESLTIRTIDGTVLAPGKVVEVEAGVYVWDAAYDVLEIFSAADARSPAWTWVATVRPGGAGFQRLRATFTLPPGGLQAIRGSFYYAVAGTISPPVACRGAFYGEADDVAFGVQVGPDATAPVVAFAAPLEGATLTGSTAVTVTATDDPPVAGAELLLDGVVVATWSAPPFSLNWDPSAASPGVHTFVARAWDPAGNVGTASRTVKVARDTAAPSVAITDPVAGASVSGYVVVRAVATDDHGVAAVEFYANGNWLGTSYQQPASMGWATSSYASGPVTLEARARDAAGNVGRSTVTVNVLNDTVPPSVALTAPVAGAVVSGAVSLQADATDALSGVARVEFYADALLVGTSTAAPYVATWSTTVVADGLHALTARAIDRAGNAATSASVSVQVRNNPASAVYDPTYRAPRCASPQAACDTGTLVNGRAGLGPEANRPNTLGGTCQDGASGTYHVDESLDRLRISSLDGLPFAAGKVVRIEATVWVWGWGSDYLDLYSAPDASSPQWKLVTTLRPSLNGAQTLSTTVALPAGSVQAIRGVFRYGGAASPCSAGAFDDRDDLVFAVQ